MKRQGTGSIAQGDFTTVNHDDSGVTGHVSSTVSGLLRNPATINSDVTISANENAVVAGPLEIGDATLTILGTLVIV